MSTSNKSERISSTYSTTSEWNISNTPSILRRYSISKSSFRRFRLVKLLKRFIALFFTQIGLLFLVVAYTICGAFLFQRIEQKPYYDNLIEKMNDFKQDEIMILKQAYLLKSLSKEEVIGSQSEKINFKIGQSYAFEKLMREMKKLGSNLTQHNFDSFLDNLNAQLKSHDNLMNEKYFLTNLKDLIELLDSFKKKIYAAFVSGWRYESQLNHYIELINKPPDSEDFIFNHMLKSCSNDTVNCKNDEITQNVWSISQSLLFTITVITTIGYGNLVPKTVPGKITTIFYAIFGIPLMLLFLANLGNFMADVVKLSYKLTCYKLTNEYHEEINRKRRKKSNAPLHGKTFPKVSPVLDTALASITEEGNISSPMEQPNRKIQTTLVLDESLEENKAPVYKPILRKEISKVSKDRKMARNSSFIMKAYMRHHENSSGIVQINVPNWLTLIILVIYLLTGAFIYAIEESWTFSDAIYFIFITLTTVGFGDIVPGSPEEKWKPTIQIFLLFYLIIGLAMVAMCFNLMQENIKYRVSRMAKKLKIID